MTVATEGRRPGSPAGHSSAAATGCCIGPATFSARGSGFPVVCQITVAIASVCSERGFTDRDGISSRVRFCDGLLAIHPYCIDQVFLLPEPPPEIRVMAWPYPQVDAVAGVIEVEAYSADIMVGKKRLRHLRPPMVHDYKGDRYVIVHDDGEVIAVFRAVPDRPLGPERMLTSPFDRNDINVA
jgi:hypothetical protein